jgi:hypothetical protein
LKKQTTERTGIQAAEALIKLYGRYKAKPRGQKLTLEIIRRQTGVATIQTVWWWLDKKHEPQGVTLGNLNRFLDKCEDVAWLEKMISKKGK